MNRLANTTRLSANIISLAFFFLVLLVSGCQSGSKPSKGNKFSAAPAPDTNYFQEVEAGIGINFKQSIGDEDLSNIIQSSGGGAAFLDFDKDGFVDILACSGTWIQGLSKEEKPSVLPTSHLYRNNGDGTYTDVTAKSGIEGPWYTLGATVGDYNNDGYPDIYLSNFGPNVLLKNNGNGTFSDVTKKTGVAGKNTCSVGAVWFDYDNDGYLDLYVGNYLNFDPNYKYYYAPDGFPGPMAYDAEPDVLYHNKKDGTFEDVTEAMGITDKDGRAMGVGAVDMDDDGFTDIFVANDHTLNYLWHNDGGKKFTDWGTRSGTAFSQAGEATVSMSVDFGDVNGDGIVDMFKSDDTYCSLYIGQGKGIYVDKANPNGISMAAAQFVGWSSTFFDYDNDGSLDLYKTNGALKHLYGQEDQIFHNDGTGMFKDVSLELGKYFKRELVGRGAAIADYDNDGDLDVLIVNLNDKAVMLRNNKGNSNNWIELNLEGTVSNRDGIGAKVIVTAGGKVQTNWKKSTAGYLSQCDPRMHFGLAKNENIEKIEIKWPSGKVQVLENVKVNQILNVTEPK
jgi:enediyne biosynthesis protein E4